MSRLLWKYYLQDDLESFQQLLANANFSGTNTKPSYQTHDPSTVAGSPGRGLATSPAIKSKLKGRQSTGITLTRGDLNWKDQYGRTLLHRMATSNEPRATEFALALLKAPLLDLYAQDLENGWTSLHRALYYGNITIARALMTRDIEDAVGVGGTSHAGGLIKIKDKDGLSPFDVYNDTIADRILDHGLKQSTIGAGDAEGDEVSEAADEEEDKGRAHAASVPDGVNGNEVFMFGSNKNYNLGFADGDDRQFPERAALKRPGSLLKKHHQAHIEAMTENAKLRLQNIDTSSPASVPAVVRSKQLQILDVQLAKMHSAILTTDSESNLYICGFGPGCRLGTGDEQTRFSFTSVTGGGLGSKKIVAVALGQNHTLAITSEGETYSWGSNVHGQLGYTLAKESLKEEDQVQPLPRQIFGSLKREFVIGCAASKTHSVVHTKTSLFTFGKNEGQLGLVDADARGLELQVTPRQVALSRFQSAILMVSAIDTATICLFDNHDVLVFTNYGYSRLQLPLDGFGSVLAKNGAFVTRHAGQNNFVVKICSGGNTICALTSEGEVLTVALRSELSPNAISTTNPSKIRDSVTSPQKLWSIRREAMAARDVDVGQDGSVIICTASGSVWRREKRAKIKDANSGHVKDYKFSRVPGLTRIVAVRSNAFGAFAAVRKDCDVLKTQLVVEPPRLWKDMYSLLPLRAFIVEENSDTEEPEPRYWKPKPDPYDPALIRKAIIRSSDLEKDFAMAMNSLGSFDDSTYDLKIGSTISDTRIPIHSFLLAARSPVMRTALQKFAQDYFFNLQDIFIIEYDKLGHPVVIFNGLDSLSLLVLVFYLYTDGVMDVWHMTKNAPSLIYAYKQARVELMKLANMLEFKDLERATRLMTEPGKVMNRDLDRALADSTFLSSGDLEVELDGDSRIVHSTLMCQRCPFFEGLFFGHARGGWLAQRKEESTENSDLIKVDLTHIDPAIFDVVLRYLYADVDDTLFEDVVTDDLDLFLDLILDVMAVANELMLDRLSQICQKILGSYVNTRNVSELLNAVAPFSVTDFKDASLEYICLNLEGMLENGLLDELDEDLMVELDAMVQENQLATMPFARSGRVEAELLDKDPNLAEKLDRARQALIDSVALRSRLHEDEARAEKLAARTTSSDLLFDMDEDGSSTPVLDRSSMSPRLGPRRLSSHGDSSQPSTPQSRSEWLQKPPLTPTQNSIPDKSPLATTPIMQARTITPSHSPATSSTPWASTSFKATKLDMKQIMAQTSEVRQSDLSAAFASSSSTVKAAPITKLSQKERKRQQQQQQHEQLLATPSTPNSVNKQSPWQTVSSSPRITLENVIESQRVQTPPVTIRSTSSPSLTLRQTIPGNSQPSRKEQSSVLTAPQAKRTVSQPASASQLATSTKTTTSVAPHSVRHNTASSSPEPSLQLSMGDILAQQQREKQLLKEAVAKRSLLEIQEEQAFQDWWDKEEAATKARMEEEEEAAKAPKDSKSRGHGRRGGKRGGKRPTGQQEAEQTTGSKSKRGGHTDRGRASGRRGHSGTST